MKISNNHFSVVKENENLYIIKENISLVHDAYQNDPLNMYLILGTDKALLVDTGCGLYPLRPIIEELRKDRELIVLNTHFHWDHVLGNREFEEVKIHMEEKYIVSYPYDVSFFKSSPKDEVKKYEKYNYLIPPAKNVSGLKDGVILDLGGSKVEVIHTPGHSPGSICLLTSTGELLTSDVAYYGDIFLPNRNQFSIVLESISKLIKVCRKNNPITLYPSHCQTPCSSDLLIKLKNGIENIKDLWDFRRYSDFFTAWEIDDPPFRYYISKN